MREIADLVDRVLDVLEERGRLTKADVDALLAPSPEEYVALRETLRKRPRIEIGPRKTGGFSLRHRPDREDDGPLEAITLAEWERAAVERLCSLLSHGDLVDLLGQELVYTLRVIRKQETGRDSSGRKEELAAALIVKYGTELFQNTDVRDIVFKRVRSERRNEGQPAIEPPGKWHPGKNGAIAFVTHARFPKEFIGVPADDRLADFEYLEGRVVLRGLEQFQLEVKDEAVKVLTVPGERAIVSLPTGAGKTRTAVEALKTWLNIASPVATRPVRQTVVWLAHTEELCEQAFASVKQVWEGSSDVRALHLLRFWGDYTSDLTSHRETVRRATEESSIFVSTPNRLISLLDEESEDAKYAVRCLIATAGALVIDEAHRAATPSYKRIVDAFQTPGGPAVIGLTATPYRLEYLNDGQAGTKSLFAMFSKVIEPIESLGSNPRERLQEMGILARPVLESFKTSTRLTVPPGTSEAEPTDQEAGKIDRALMLEADTAQRRLKILGRILEICRQDSNNSIIYFGPSVSDAEHMAFLVRKNGFQSAVVSGDTRDSARRRVVGEFKTGAVKVLCNCEVLTTGFDAPRVTHVIVARPTVSQVLYEQMVGRGLRGERFGGTASCVIVNCEDDYRATRPELGYVGWRQAWQPKQTG